MLIFFFIDGLVVIISIIQREAIQWWHNLQLLENRDKVHAITTHMSNCN